MNSFSTKVANTENGKKTICSINVAGKKMGIYRQDNEIRPLLSHHIHK
jgi:hypothetical protein